jgi:signal transduction histidine kinase
MFSMVGIEKPRYFRGFRLDNCEQTAKFLMRASEGLASSLDYETTLETVAHVAVPCLTDLGIVEIVQDGRLKPVASAHADARKEGLLRKLAVTSGGDSPANAVRALRTRQPVIVKAISDRLLWEFAQQERVPVDPRTVDGIHQIGPESTISMPLVARGRTLGVLSLARLDGSPPFEKDDLPLIRQLAHQCAQAVDNARLYHEATEAARARQELIATTSHELRSPLSEIKGFVTTLLQSNGQCDDATRTDFLREIDRGADRLDALIGDLLEVSRLENAGTQVQRDLIRPDVLVCRALDGVRLRLSGVEVEIGSNLRRLPAIWVDARRIQQVITNLVENAFKYAPGSDIRLGGRVVDAGNTVEIAVEDDGPGIPVEDLEHIFDSYYRGATRERSEVPGTGLGLAIARTIVQGHGGRIRAENREGGGARFVVSLPSVAATV